MWWKQPIPVDLEHNFAGDKKLFMFFVLLLLKACRSSQKIWTKKWLVELSRWQILFSRNVFASYLGMSPSWCRDKCKELAGKYQKIDMRLTHQGHIITIRDFDTLTAFESPDCHEAISWVPHNWQGTTTFNKKVKIEEIVKTTSNDVSCDSDSDIVTLSKPRSKAAPAISEFVAMIKLAVEKQGFIYKSSKYERARARDILNHKPFGEFSEKLGLDRKESAIRVLLQSTKHDFWRGKIYNCETLYKHYAKVYNDFVRDIDVGGGSDLSSFVV